MTRAEAIFIIGQQLRFVLFGLECALHVEFNPDETERVFADAGTDVDGFLDSRAKRYMFWDAPGLRVTGQVDDHEPETLRLIVESTRTIEPSLSAIGERAAHQMSRMRRWQEQHPEFIPGN